MILTFINLFGNELWFDNHFFPLNDYTTILLSL